MNELSFKENSPKVWCHTLAFKNKVLIPKVVTKKVGASVLDVRRWISQKFQVPVLETRLVTAGKELEDSQLVRNISASGDAVHIYLVCRAPLTDNSFIKIYVKDTTRTPNKMYAVKMSPAQNSTELKQKLYHKSSCSVPIQQQQLTVRGKVLDDTFSLREYTISQRRNRVILYLTKDPKTLGDEELSLTLTIPSNNAIVKTTMLASQTVSNLRQFLETSHGIQSAKYSVLNVAGMVLQNDMTIRTACTMPNKATYGKPGMNLALFAIPIPEKTLTRGVTGVTVFLNPQHHASLGIIDPIGRGSFQDKDISNNMQSRRRSNAKCNSPCFKGFRGVFKKNNKSVCVTPDTSSVKISTSLEKDLKKRKKKKKSSYKSYMKSLMQSSQFASSDDRVAQYREKLRKSMGGGAYKRVDSI